MDSSHAIGCEETDCVDMKFHIYRISAPGYVIVTYERLSCSHNYQWCLHVCTSPMGYLGDIDVIARKGLSQKCSGYCPTEFFQCTVHCW